MRGRIHQNPNHPIWMSWLEIGFLEVSLKTCLHSPIFMEVSKRPEIFSVIDNFTVPPLAQGSELAGLSLDGENVQAQEYRWYPYQLLRRTRIKNLQIVTTVRMPFEESGILFSIEASNLGSEARTARLAVNLQAAIRHYPLKWTWDTPRPRREDLSDFSTKTTGSGSQRIVLNQDSRSTAKVVLVFLQEPVEVSEITHSAGWSFHLEPGQRFRIEFVMAAGTDFDLVTQQASSWRERFSETWEAARDLWKHRFYAGVYPGERTFLRQSSNPDR